MVYFTGTLVLYQIHAPLNQFVAEMLQSLSLKAFGQTFAPFLLEQGNPNNVA